MFLRFLTIILLLYPFASLAEVFTWASQGGTNDRINDPHYWHHKADWRIGRQVYEPLVLKGSGSEYIPVLAESLEFRGVNTLEVQLKSRVEFHDGRSLEADDVVFSILRAQGEHSKIRGIAARFTSIESSDSYTVTMQFSGGKDDAIVSLSNIMIMDREWSEQNDLAEVKPNLQSVEGNGTGAFIIASYQPGIELILVKNEGYREEINHEYHKVKVTYIGDIGQSTSAIQSGDVSYIDSLNEYSMRILENRSDINIYKFLSDLFYVSEADTKADYDFSSSRYLVLPQFQSVVSSLLDEIADLRMNGYPAVAFQPQADLGVFEDGIRPDEFPRDLIVYCQYREGPYSQVCDLIGNELDKNRISHDIRYDEYEIKQADIFVGWRRLENLRLPAGSYGDFNDKESTRTSLPLMSAFKAIAARSDVEISYGISGVPLLSPYAEANDDDDECDKCPPSGACSQSIILSRQQCCPPSGACAQMR